MRNERSISVIGLGRVGLPLALCFADRGLRVLGVDHDPAVLESIRAGRMPFAEAGTQELLGRVADTGRFELTDRAADAAQADDIVITIGTPSFSHIESDLRQVRAAVDDLLPLLRATIRSSSTDFARTSPKHIVESPRQPGTTPGRPSTSRLSPDGRRTGMERRIFSKLGPVRNGRAGLTCSARPPSA